MLAPTGADPDETPPVPSVRRSLYLKLLLAGGAALLSWALLPHLPEDQRLVFALGPHPERLIQLQIQWEAVGQEHEGSLTLNFPAPTSEPVVRQLRLANGQYAFRVTAQRAATSERTEVMRKVTLEGGTLILHLEELTE